MFKRKGCVKVDDIIQASYDYKEVYPKLIELSHKSGYVEVLDEYVISKISNFYSRLNEKVRNYMSLHPIFED